MTFGESRAYLENNQEAIAQDISELLKQAGVEQTKAQTQQSFVAGLKQQFLDTGRFDEKASKAYASVLGGYYKSLGDNLAVDAQSLHSLTFKDFSGVEVGQGNGLGQAYTSRQKEIRGVHNVMHNHKQKTLIRKSDTDSVVAFERGFQSKRKKGRSGFGSVHIQKHLPDGSFGQISKHEAVMMVDMLKDDNVDFNIEPDGKRKYQKKLSDGHILTLLIGDREEGERVITIYTDRNVDLSGKTNSSTEGDPSAKSPHEDSTTPVDGVNKLYQFAGVNAKTANLGNLASAEQMIEDGIDADAVWKETGWEKGTDGQWKWEIDDSGAKWKPEIKAAGIRVVDAIAGQNVSMSGARKPYKVSELLNHDSLFAAYPSVAGVQIESYSENNKSMGAYHPQENKIYINTRLGLTSDEGLLSVVMHEIQHAIQQEENFARGGSPSDFENNNISEYRGLLQAYVDTARLMVDYGKSRNDVLSTGVIEPEYAEKIAALPYESFKYAVKHAQEALASPFSKYRRLAGEVEARNTQTRQTMSALERLARSPLDTQDVPNDKQIVRFSGGRAEMATPEIERLLKIDAEEYIDAPNPKEKWDGDFPTSIVNTPIGEYKMGENQFEKLVLNKRLGQVGLIKPTLENPTYIVKDGRDGTLFIKAFYKTGIDGNKKFKGFVAVSYGIDGVDVVVSNHIKGLGKISDIVNVGDVIYQTERLSRHTDSSHARDSMNYTATDGVLDSNSNTPVDGVNKLYQSSTQYTAPTITVDGVERSTTDSTGKQIAQTEQGIINFWRWFGDSKVVDEAGELRLALIANIEKISGSRSYWRALTTKKRT